MILWDLKQIIADICMLDENSDCNTWKRSIFLESFGRISEGDAKYKILKEAGLNFGKLSFNMIKHTIKKYSECWLSPGKTRKEVVKSKSYN